MNLKNLTKNRIQVFYFQTNSSVYEKVFKNLYTKGFGCVIFIKIN